MKTKKRGKDKVNIVTLGCSKNLVDSEVMMTQLKGNKIDVTHECIKDDANIVIINTCGFIENAKQESIDTIIRYTDAKEEGLIDKVYVTGCLSQRYRDDLQSELPEVDAWFGTLELPMLLKKFNADYKHELLGDRITSTAQHFSYLKISEGCNRPCSFCAIPIMRGRHVSKPIELLVKEAESLVKNGSKEILLIAQDSTFYGIDLYRKRALAQLMDRLADIEGLEWIRLHYAFPMGFPMDVLDVMNARENICNYLDIPLQHASDHQLKLMRRGTTRAKTTALLDKIRNKVPDIAIRTTMITGHPGETEHDFQELLDFVNEQSFERLGVFTYSHEDQTHSFSMKDDVPVSVKEKRAAIIMNAQEKISESINEKKIGQTFRVLVDRMEGGRYIGRTEKDSPEVDNEVIIDTDRSYLRIGDFYNVRITSSSAFDLYGSPA